jgi:lysophospholipase L1-like esterase
LRTRTRIAWTTAISLLIGAAAAEILLRRLCTVCTWTEQNAGGYVSPYQEPPENGWYHLRRPSSVSNYGQPEFDYELRTNSMGIRDVEHPVEKRPGEYRIVGLGDSFTEGQGAPYEDSYLKILERKLRKSPVDRDVRVIVGGVAGSDPFYCYKLLEDRLLRFQPDLIMLAINSSDVTDTIARGGNERFRPDGQVRFAPPPRDEWIFARSHVYRAFTMTVLGYDWFGLSPGEHASKRADAIEKLKALAADYQSLAEREASRFLVILHPDAYELTTATYSFDAEGLMQFLAGRGIPYLDLMPYFLERTGSDPRRIETIYWEKDFHHNTDGYRLFAEGVEEYLRASGLATATLPLESPDLDRR